MLTEFFSGSDGDQGSRATTVREIGFGSGERRYDGDVEEGIVDLDVCWSVEVAT